MIINPIMANIILNHKFLPAIKLPSSSRFVIKAITKRNVNTNIPTQNPIILNLLQFIKESADFKSVVFNSELNFGAGK